MVKRFAIHLLLTTCFIATAMEEQAEKKQKIEPESVLEKWRVEHVRYDSVLSLKYQAALCVYCSLEHNLLIEQSDEYLAEQMQLPIELIPYIREFHTIDQQCLSLIMSAYQLNNNKAEWPEKAIEVYRCLRTRFFPFIDGADLKHKESLGLLMQLADKTYLPEHQAVLVNIFQLNKSERKPKERVFLSDMLHVAIKKNHNNLVAFLLANGAYLNKPENDHEATPLFTSIIANNIQACVLLIEACVLKKGDEAALKIRELLTANASDVYCPFQYAITFGRVEIVHYLLEIAKKYKLTLEEFQELVDGDMSFLALALSDPKELDPSEPYHDTAQRGDVNRQIEAVKYFLEFIHGQWENLDDEFLHITSAHRLAPEVIAFLLENATHYDINPRVLIDAFGGVNCLKNLAHFHSDIGNLLVTFVEFADRNNIQLSSMDKAAVIAAQAGSFELIGFLMDSGYLFDLEHLFNKRDERGQTLAMRLVAANNVERFKRLLDFAFTYDVTVSFQDCVTTALDTVHFDIVLYMKVDGIAYLKKILLERDADNDTYLLRLVHQKRRIAAERVIDFAQKYGIELPELEHAQELMNDWDSDSLSVHTSDEELPMLSF